MHIPLRTKSDPAKICRRADTKAASAVPAAWQDRLYPRSGWFRVSAAGVPEPRLLEVVRLHCLPEQDLRCFLRRLSSCHEAGQALTCRNEDTPEGFSECLEFIVKARRAQYGLLGAQSKSIQAIAAHARSAGFSKSLSRQQAASIVISGELHCLEKLEQYLSSVSPGSLAERALSAWQRRKPSKQRDVVKLQT